MSKPPDHLELRNRDMDVLKPAEPCHLSLLSSRCVNPFQFSFAGSTRFLAVLTLASVLSGCGSKPVDVADSKPGATESGNTLRSTQLEPTEIVSQFLDRVRRGGKDSGSSELLTKLAQQELTRIGRPFEFPGSPDTVFEVRQAFPVPDQPDLVWVHTYLIEPGEAGQNVQYEVVWTLRNETVGWRVCGFVIDQGEGLEPLEFDFEDGDAMASKLAALEQVEEPVRR